MAARNAYESRLFAKSNDDNNDVSLHINTQSEVLTQIWSLI
jgi:hypothetical protein